jgi:DUF1365 family protein
MYQVVYNLYEQDEFSFLKHLKNISDNHYHVAPHIFWIYSKEGLDVHKVAKDIINNFGPQHSFIISPIDSHDVDGWISESANKWRNDKISNKE